MWTSHKTSFGFVRPSFTRHDLCRSVTMSISSLRTTSDLQTEKRGPTLRYSNQKHATESRQPLQNEPFGDYGTCAGSAARTLFPFNLGSMIFVSMPTPRLCRLLAGDSGRKGPALCLESA